MLSTGAGHPYLGTHSRSTKPLCGPDKLRCQLTQEILLRFKALQANSLSRSEVSAWAKGVDERIVSFRPAPDTGLWYEALFTLRGAATTGESVLAIEDSLEGPPYFLRMRDISEWHRRLEQPSSDPDATLQESVVTLSGIVNHPSLQSTLRGVDGLDFFEEWELLTPGGRQAVLQHHRGAPADMTVGHVELLGQPLDEVLSDLLDGLQLQPTNVTWRNPALS